MGKKIGIVVSILAVVAAVACLIMKSGGDLIQLDGESDCEFP